MASRRAIFVAPFDELYQPAALAELAARAEDRGWDGFFVWDHMVYVDAREVADPWVALAAVATATERITIGPLVTPLPRRRATKLARETVTLDHLSEGRLVFGVGLGGDRSGEFDSERFGEEDEPKKRAKLLDDGLERLLAYWDGEFEPRAVQKPRIPIWVAGRWPNRRPLQRAARFEGLFPIDLPGPDELATMVSQVRELGAGEDYDIVVSNPPGEDPGRWEEAGATWCLTGFGSQPRLAEVEEAIDAR